MQVECIYPEEENQSLAIESDEFGKQIAFVALPDASHCVDVLKIENLKNDYGFFILHRNIGNQTEVYYGVSCYRQIEAALVKKDDDEITRPYVQKVKIFKFYGRLFVFSAEFLYSERF